MRLAQSAAIFSVCAWIAVAVWADTKQGDLTQRQELKRADLTMTPEMEVITSISEFKKGDTVPRHSHHGLETGYIVQGTMVQAPGQAPTMMQTGSSFMNLRDVPHGGYTVVGDQSLKILSVHVVDKNKPLYEWVK